MSPGFKGAVSPLCWLLSAEALAALSADGEAVGAGSTASCEACRVSAAAGAASAGGGVSVSPGFKDTVSPLCWLLSAEALAALSAEGEAVGAGASSDNGSAGELPESIPPSLFCMTGSDTTAGSFPSEADGESSWGGLGFSTASVRGGGLCSPEAEGSLAVWPLTVFPFLDGESDRAALPRTRERSKECPE